RSSSGRSDDDQAGQTSTPPLPHLGPLSPAFGGPDVGERYSLRCRSDHGPGQRLAGEPQHFLYLRSEAHQQASLRPGGHGPSLGSCSVTSRVTQVEMVSLSAGSRWKRSANSTISCTPCSPALRLVSGDSCSCFRSSRSAAR